MFGLLGRKNFLLLWFGQICSQSGDRLLQMILVALVAERAAGSTLTLATVMAMTSLPGLLVNPFAGAYVDRWDRKKTMIVCDIVRAAAVVLLPWLAHSPSGVPMYSGVFFIFSVATFFIPARLATIPDIVPAKDLAQANALFSSSGMIGSAIMLLVGALLVEWIGVARSCWVNGLFYFASSLFILPVTPERKHEEKETHSVRWIFHEIAEGMQQLWRHRATRDAMLLVMLLTAGAGASFVTGAVIIQKALGSVTKDLGFLSLWAGIGMIGGALSHGRWGSRAPRGLVLGLCFMGAGCALWLFIAAAMWLKSSIASSIAAALIGFWIAPVGIVVNTMVHEGHTPRLHGRIFSSMGVAMNLALISAMLTAGWFGDHVNRGLVLAAVGGIFAVSGLILLCYTEPRKRRKAA